MAGPTNVKPLQFAPKPKQAAVERTEFTQADLRHARIVGAFAGFLAGLAVMFGIIWLATTWSAQSSVETFSRGVAVGQAVGAP